MNTDECHNELLHSKTVFGTKGLPTLECYSRILET